MKCFVLKVMLEARHCSSNNAHAKMNTDKASCKTKCKRRLNDQGPKAHVCVFLRFLV